MSYRYLPDMATADAAFAAWATTLEQLFGDAAEATLRVMVGNVHRVRALNERKIVVSEPSLDLLLHAFLQEIVYYKDAENLLLRFRDIAIEELPGGFRLTATGWGEQIDPARHELLMDVKSVTLHELRVERGTSGWEATVVLDI